MKSFNGKSNNFHVLRLIVVRDFVFIDNYYLIMVAGYPS